MVKNIWKSYIWIADKDMNESDPYSNVHYLLPVGLLAQLVERCTGIAEVIGSNPVQAWIFFRPYFHYCLSSALSLLPK